MQLLQLTLRACRTGGTGVGEGQGMPVGLSELYKLGKAIGELAVEKTARYSGLDEKVLTQVLDARIGQLFQADFLLGLLKRQIGHVFKPFYIALLIQLGLLLALVAAEWGVSRWLRQLPARQPVEPLAQL